MGLALWGETRRWRNPGRVLGGGTGADPWDCAPVCPGGLTLLGGGVWDRS